MPKSLLWAVSLLLLLAGCVHESALPTPDPTPKNDTTTSTCSPDTVYFQRDVLPVLVSNCAMSGCHDDATAADGIRLTSYAQVIQSGKVEAGNASDSKLYKVLTDSDPEDRMPPAPASALQTAQIALIQQWINQGAKDLTCTNGCDTIAVTYTLVVQPFVQSTCLGCHSGSSPSAGVSLSTYSEVKAVAQSGGLYGVLTNTGGYPQMPPGGTVSTCTQNQIKAWIQQGTPE